MSAYVNFYSIWGPSKEEGGGSLFLEKEKGLNTALRNFMDGFFKNINNVSDW